MGILSTLRSLLVSDVARQGRSATQPPYEVFKLPAGVTLIADEEIILALPRAMIGEHEVIGSVIQVDDKAQFSLNDKQDLILLKLRQDMRVTLTKHAEVFLVTSGPNDRRPRRLRAIIP